MRAITTIFALFLLIAYRDAKSFHVNAEVLIFPQAAPVQFWLTGCDTNNQTIPKGVHYKCFCQPWKCSDTILIPFRDTFEESDIIESENIVPITLPDLDEWVSLAGLGDYAWSTGASPTINLPGTGFPGVLAEYLAAEYAFEAGKEYTITVNYNFVVNSGTQNPRTTRLSILDDDNVSLFTTTTTPISSGAYSISITFTATETCSKVAIRHTSGRNVDLTITSASGTRTDVIRTYPSARNYDLVIYSESDEELDRISFDSLLVEAGLFHYHTASVDLAELGICEEQIRFEVEDMSSSPDTVVAQSDCQKITDSEADPTTLIEYSSLKNFNGLLFEGVSPEQVYNIRIPAVFFHEDFPQEDEVAKLTSKVVKLNSQTQAKRRLDVDFIPYYMTLKIQLILSMPILLIDGLYWTKQDAYNKNEGSKRWPTKSASCWLTQRDFLERQSI